MYCARALGIWARNESVIVLGATWDLLSSQSNWGGPPLETLIDQLKRSVVDPMSNDFLILNVLNDHHWEDEVRPVLLLAATVPAPR